MANNSKVKITLITTGGTIDKTYDEQDGSLENRESIIREAILSGLRLPYTELDVQSILSKDSLYLTDEDREHVCTTIKYVAENKKTPIVVIHGTDTMSVTAEYCFQKLPKLKVPVIFTGAMKPVGFFQSDAPQNVTEALLAAKLLAPGIYISFHSRIFSVPQVRKNKEKRTFEAID
jgi:L-asparaginase